MAGYALSPAARADLEEIWDYTVERWGEAQAERYIRDIQKACEALSGGALVSRSAGDIRAGYRKAAVGSHVIYFRARSDPVQIVRILHRRMDVARHIRALPGGRSKRPARSRPGLRGGPRPTPAPSCGYPVASSP